MIENLSAREKKLVFIALGMVAFIAFFSLIKNIPMLFQPSLRTQVERKRSDFENIIPKLIKLNKLKQSRHEYKDFSEISMFQFITDNKPKLNVDDNDEMVMNQIDKGVQIQFKAVSFDDLILWLDQLHKRNGVSVTFAEFTAISDKSGYVGVNIVLQ